jgi:hypothetical protein
MNSILTIIFLFFLFLFYQSHNEAFAPIKKISKFVKADIFIDDYYDNKFIDKMNTEINILLIGNVKETKINYFYKTFPKSKIYVINEDEIDYKNIYDSNVKIINENPYNNLVINKLKDLSIKIDIILLSSILDINNIIYCIKNYTDLLNIDGIFLVENLQSYMDIDTLIKSFDINFKNKIEIIDYRKFTNNVDDIILSFNI